MKNIISMFIMCLVVICGACSNEDDYNNSSSSHETQNVELDGTLSENNPSDTVTINGVKIINKLQLQTPYLQFISTILTMRKHHS